MNGKNTGSPEIATRAEKEARLGQRGIVVWFYGLSGAGKSTLARAVENRLIVDGLLTKIIDGDVLRNGLNKGLGYDDDDRAENIRRAAEIAKLFLDTGVVTLCAFICPKREMRKAARNIVGKDDFVEVFAKASYEACAIRDVKGLYAKAERGEISRFTGRDSAFEEPEPGSGAIVLDTERHGIAHCANCVLETILPRIRS